MLNFIKQNSCSVKVECVLNDVEKKDDVVEKIDVVECFFFFEHRCYGVLKDEMEGVESRNHCT